MQITDEPVRWGILGAARIADGAILPALRNSEVCLPWAIAARVTDRARAMAERHSVPKSYGSYDALLADPNVEAVYIALPNHLHIEWARKAVDAGKHVLVEKPAAMRAAEFAVLDRVDPALRIAEAFMVRHQPRWQHLRKLMQDRTYGAPLTISSLLSFHMTKADDFRQTPDMGATPTTTLVATLPWPRASSLAPNPSAQWH